MRIKTHDFSVEAKKQTLIELQDLLNQSSVLHTRPCPGCRFVTPDGCTDSSSTQYCSYHCPAAPEQMSSDPKQYPIEDGIVPMVYAFYTLGKLMPCWSCEGHLDGHNQLYKPPKVWFYSTSGFYPKLIAQALDKLEADHKISHDWIVRTLPYSQSMYTVTYSLEPFLLPTQLDDDNLLKTLRSDIKVIADNLKPELTHLCKHYIELGNKTPFNNRP